MEKRKFLIFIKIKSIYICRINFIFTMNNYNLAEGGLAFLGAVGLYTASKLAPVATYTNQLRIFATFIVVISVIIALCTMYVFYREIKLVNLDSVLTVIPILCLIILVLCFLNILFWQEFIMNSDALFHNIYNIQNVQNVQNIQNVQEKEEGFGQVTTSYGLFLKKVFHHYYSIEKKSSRRGGGGDKMILKRKDNLEESPREIWTHRAIFKNYELDMALFDKNIKQCFDSHPNTFFECIENNLSIATLFNFQYIVSQKFKKYIEAKFLPFVGIMMVVIVYLLLLNTVIVQVVQKINVKCISSEYTTEWFNAVKIISIPIIIILFTIPTVLDQNGQNGQNSQNGQIDQNGQQRGKKENKSLYYHIFYYGVFFISFTVLTFIFSGIYCQLYHSLTNLDFTFLLIVTVALYIGMITFLYEKIIYRPLRHVSNNFPLSFVSIYQSIVVSMILTLVIHSVTSISSSSSLPIIFIFLFLLSIQYPFILITSNRMYKTFESQTFWIVWERVFYLFCLSLFVYISVLLSISSNNTIKTTKTINTTKTIKTINSLKSSIPFYLSIILVVYYAIPKIFYILFLKKMQLYQDAMKTGQFSSPLLLPPPQLISSLPPQANKPILPIIPILPITPINSSPNPTIPPTRSSISSVSSVSLSSIIEDIIDPIKSESPVELRYNNYMLWSSVDVYIMKKWINRETLGKIIEKKESEILKNVSNARLLLLNWYLMVYWMMDVENYNLLHTNLEEMEIEPVWANMVEFVFWWKCFSDMLHQNQNVQQSPQNYFKEYIKFHKLLEKQQTGKNLYFSKKGKNIVFTFKDKTWDMGTVQEIGLQNMTTESTESIETICRNLLILQFEKNVK